MKTNYSLRYASHPVDAKNYDTQRLRKEFLIETLFVNDEVNMVYSMYDRMIVGGVMPKTETLLLKVEILSKLLILPLAARLVFSM